MHRLPLLLCTLALLGSAVSAALFFRIGNSKQVLERQLTDAAARAAKLDTDLAQAHERSGALQSQVATLDRELDATKARLTTAEARTAQLTIDLKQTRSVLSVYEQTAQALASEVGALRQDLEESRTSNATPEAVAAYKNAIAELERQLALAHNGAALTATTGASTAVFASRAGRATVLTVGPENSFVVLNFGSERGAKLGQTLTVSQGTAEVATVLINDVRAHFSVAHVLPDSLRAALQKGDSALLVR